MFCTKCGTKLEENVQQCPHCGAPVVGKVAPQQEANRPSPGNTVEKAKNGIAKLLKKLILSGIAAVAVIVLVVMILLGQPKKINLENLVVANFHGYNTVGTVGINWDSENFYLELSKALNKKDVSLEAPAIYAACSFSTESSTGLSNGDEVVVKIEYDNDAVKDYKIKFTGDEAKFTVEGLEDLVEIDPFQGLSVSFSGISPNGTATYEYTGDTTYVTLNTFNFDKTGELKNGDTVTASVRYSNEDTVYNGFLFTETSRTFTVEGLDEYVDSYSKLTEEFLTHAKQESEDAIAAYVANNYNENSVLSPVSYAGYVFCARKPGGNSSDYNGIYLIYRGTVSHSTGAFLEADVYFPVLFKNILSADGKDSCNEDPVIMGDSSLVNLSGGWQSYTTKGYTIPFTAYADLVTAHADRYTVEVGDGFEKYAEYTPIEKLSDIRVENLKTVTDKAQDIVRAYLAKEFPDFDTPDFTVAGEYLLTAKAQGADYQNNNQLIVVCSATVSSETVANFEPRTVYFPVRFKGLISLPGDEFLYLSQSTVLGDSGFTHELGHFLATTAKGYSDEARMFSDLVTANRVNYNYEVSEGLKTF